MSDDVRVCGECGGDAAVCHCLNCGGCNRFCDCSEDVDNDDPELSDGDPAEP